MEFLLPPLFMCFLLAGIHCYLGLHVLSRGVIFVDLSLAQVASLGAALALLYDPEHHGGYWISLSATFLAAGLFAFARRQEKFFQQEAVIGLVYALASGAVVLVVDQLAHGAEHLKESLVGHILWVTWEDVSHTAVVYAFVAVIHYFCRKQLLASSARKAHWVWDFLFYALFGVVITSSTRVAGVLLVFSFLIVPAMVSTVFFKSIRSRLLFGWGLGMVLSAVGMGLSYKFDLPAGALIVVLFTTVPILLLLITPLWAKRN